VADQEGTAPVIESDLARRPGRPGRAATAGVAIVAVAILAGAAAAERSWLAGSLSELARLHWTWLPVGILLEATSIAAFAGMFRRLLSAGRVRPTRTSMLATIYAANAMSVSVPLAGPGLAAAYLFRRFTRLGAGALLAGWALLAGAVISSVTWALVLVGGGLASGHTVALAITVPFVAFAIIVTAVIAVAARRPRLRAALERYLTQALKHAARLLRWPATDPKLALRAWAERFRALRVPPSSWALAAGDSLVNWLADAGVLAVSILAVGAAPAPGLRGGHQRAEPVPHSRRAGHRRGRDQRGAGRIGAARRPGRRRRGALPAGQLLAERRRGVADSAGAAGPQARSGVRAGTRAGTGTGAAAGGAARRSRTGPPARPAG
jgi:uncharacterized membrane protein YbhN (UPF0104 family)